MAKANTYATRTLVSGYGQDASGNFGKAPYNPPAVEAYTSGRYYLPWPVPAGAYANAAVGAIDTIRLFPGWILKPVTISRLAIRVGTQAVGNFQCALYNNVAGSNHPGTLIDSTGSVSTNSQAVLDGTPSGSTIAIAAPGLYWFASNFSAAPSVLMIQANNPVMAALMGSATGNSVLGTSAFLAGYTFATTFGTWPDLTGQSLTEATTAIVPGVAFKI